MMNNEAFVVIKDQFPIKNGPAFNYSFMKMQNIEGKAVSRSKKCPSEAHAQKYHGPAYGENLGT